MSRLLDSDQALLLLAKKVKREREFYDELPEFFPDCTENIEDYLESVLRRSRAVPSKLRPRRQVV